jgi:hypothetical protein
MPVILRQLSLWPDERPSWAVSGSMTFGKLPQALEHRLMTNEGLAFFEKPSFLSRPLMNENAALVSQLVAAPNAMQSICADGDYRFRIFPSRHSGQDSFHDFPIPRPTTR